MASLAAAQPQRSPVPTAPPSARPRLRVCRVVTTSLTARQRELLEELAKELGEDVQPQRRTFVEKLKNLFG